MGVWHELYLVGDKSAQNVTGARGFFRVIVEPERNLSAVLGRCVRNHREHLRRGCS
jgi:hypothetical protein